MIYLSNSFSKSLLIQCMEASNSNPSRQDSFFTNHQMWKINCHCDHESNSPVFHVTDPQGFSFTIEEFIISNVDLQFQSLLANLTPEEQQQEVYQYIQERLALATPYEVHIESHKNKLIVYFGNRGLKGGGKKDAAYAMSTIEIGAGIYLSATGRKGCGGVFISSGLAGGTYAYKQEDGTFTYDEYIRQTAYGALTGFISVGLGHLAKGANLALRIGYRILGGAVNNTIPVVTSEFLDSRRLPDRQTVIKKIVSGAASAGAGALGSVAAEHLAFEPRVVKGPIDAAVNALGQGFEGAVSGASSKTVTNLLEKEGSFNEALLWGCVDGIITGSITFVEQFKGIQQLEQIKSQLEKAQQDIQRLRKEKGKHEISLQILEGDLQESEENLAEKRSVLDSKPISLQENLTGQPVTEESIPNAKKQLDVACRELYEAEQHFEKSQKAVNAAESKANTIGKQIFITEHESAQVQQEYTNLVANLDREIVKHLQNGFKAEIDGKQVTFPATIREAYVEGKKINWNRHINKKMNPYKSLKDQSEKAQEKQREAQQKVQQLQGSVKQAQADFTSFKDQLKQDRLNRDLKQNAVEKAEAHINEIELNIAQNRLKFYQNKFQQAQFKLQEIQSKESDLAGQVKEWQRVIEKGGKSYAKPPIPIDHYRGSALNQALEPQPVFFVENDCSMHELIPHVVLVHSLNETAFTYYPGFDWSKEGDQKERALGGLKGVITPEGTVGKHLPLEKHEFQGALIDRPQLHWSWNQLVQPNGGRKNDGTPVNNWENSQVAILEPLSTFEESIYQRPFAITPYDTMTFGSHRFSIRSILLVPKAIEKEARAYLTGFQGQIIPYEGVLRSAIIDNLDIHYPETWHMCDETGNLIGKHTRYSATGRDRKTCIKKKNEDEIIILVQNLNPNEQVLVSQAMQEYQGAKRFIGLHIHATTFWIEEDAKVYFRQLKNFANNPIIVRNNPLFAGSINNADALVEWGALQAWQFKLELQNFDPKTGAAEVANYIINEALYADLVSLFYKRNPGSQFDLCTLDLKILIESVRIELMTLLDDIKRHLLDVRNRPRAFELFGLYSGIIEQSLLKLREAKKEALQMVGPSREEEGKEQEEKYAEEPKFLCLTAFQEEWANVVTPANILFDLGKNWPHSKQIIDYVNKVLRTLPSNLKMLQQMHKRLLSDSYGKEKREQYRINIICSVIQWALQEKIYLAAPDQVQTSILAYKLSKEKGWLMGYGLVSEDFTQNLSDCLFDNVIVQLPIQPKLSAQQLRRDIVTFMRKGGKDYSRKFNNEIPLCVGDGNQFLLVENWEQYLKHMGNEGAWASELEVYALADKFECPIALLSEGAEPRIINPDGIKNPLFLNCINTYHFEACSPIKGLTAKEVYLVIKRRVDR